MSTEFLISFSIIMMMLSLVSERASNFFKLYFQGKVLYIPFLYKLKTGWITHLKVRLEILAYKQPTAAAEKEREYRLMVINILIGIIIATLANANFFEIVKQISSSGEQSLAIRGFEAPFDQGVYLFGFVYMLFFLWSLSVILFSRLQEYNSQIKQYIYKYPFLLWILITIVLVLIGVSGDASGEIREWFGIPTSRFLDLVIHCLGYIFVGMFLSLGSKFWHDLLDIFLKLKNTQQVLSDPKTYTNYGSADQLIALAETSQYEVAEKLFELYKNEIAAIPGVVSYGLHTVLDEKTKLYKKIIEVEFKSEEAQKQLIALQNKGSLYLNYNTFYLKDYLVYKYTSQLVAVSSITDQHPVCYAFNANPLNANPSKGSFSVYKDGNNYFALSNLHVFADDDEFINFENNPNHTIEHKTVQFVIGDDRTQTGTIIDHKFGSFEGYGFDLCVCKVEKRLYDLFIAHIDVSKLIDIDEYSMKMFGAYTKYVNFHSFRNPTTCQVEYNGFNRPKELYLFKIGTSSPGIENINKGDSGSTVYYKIKDNNTVLLATGIIVAKSDHYAYIFRGHLLTNTNMLELWKK